jgi:uncharacterized YigZ family protein
LPTPTKDTFLTISATSEGFLKEKGSKFIAHAFPVQDVDEVKERLEELRKQYYDARHHCYAYLIGRDEEFVRANDDGEPNNSAGQPILGQIRSKNLQDVLVVVIRYFGGTKLGVGGLVTAYKTATADALENAEIVERIVAKKISFRFAYEQTNQVMRLVKDFDLPILNQKFELDCLLEVSIRESILQQVLPKLEELGDRIK